MSANTWRQAMAGRGGVWRRLRTARLSAILPIDRIGSHVSLLLFLAAGHLLALTLILVVPLYADGANSRLLQQALRETGEDPRPQNSLLLTHFSSIHGPISEAGFRATDAYLRRDLSAVVALPTAPLRTLVYSEKLRVLPADLAGELGDDPITWASFAFDDTLEERIVMVEGRLPQRRGDGEALEVIVFDRFVNEYGLRPGDKLVLRGPSRQPEPAFEAEIVGVWQPKQPTTSGWPIQPFAYEDVLIVPRAAFEADIAPGLAERAWYGLYWYAEFPREAIVVGNVARVRAGFAELEGRAARLLGNRIDLASPDEILGSFQHSAATLRTLLYVFSIPTLLIMFLYILSTAGLLADRQRAEIAVLKGRGASRSQILGAYVVEGALLNLLPLLLGPLAAFLAAQWIGRAVGFLELGPASSIPVRVTSDTLWLSVGVLAATLLVGALPVLVAARQTLVSYQQEVVRAARRPIWQRLYLDVLVLLAAGYGYYTLRRQGSLVPAGSGDGASGDPFTNPLSLLLPATALLGSALLLVRLFPALATLLARLGRRVFGASTLLALRHLARSPEQGRSIVLLTALTLGLGTFSASMATTLDQNDEDRVMYATGARLRVTEQAQMSQREKRWTVLPAWEHGEVPGVSAWSRVRIEDVATAVGGGGGAGGSLLALDRAGYHAAGWWRSDLAQAPLGSLMNTLAAEPHALIVSRRFLQASRLRLGDDVSLTLGTGERLSLRFVIRAAVDNFPMIYPKPDQFFFIGNFDYIYQSSEPGSYDVLLDLEPGADPAAVVEEIKARGFDVSDVVEPSAVIEAARTRPERVGFVGLLSLGFVAAAALTMLALLLYGLFSFRRRMVEIGVLRAAGLSLAQLVWLLAFELCFLVMTSAIAGTVLGVAAARLFVPFYQLGTTVESRTPPFIVVVAWSTIGRLLLILAVMLGITLLASTLLLRRLRIHEAIKLGQELG